MVNTPDKGSVPDAAGDAAGPTPDAAGPTPEIDAAGPVSEIDAAGPVSEIDAAGPTPEIEPEVKIKGPWIRVKTMVLRLGGQVTFAIIHIAGMAVGAYLTRVPAFLSGISKIPKNFSRASSLAWYMAVVLIFDIAGYALVMVALTKDGEKADIDASSILFVGALIGVVVTCFAHWTATRANVFWKPEDDKAPLGASLVGCYSFAISVFMVAPWLALCH